MTDENNDGMPKITQNKKLMNIALAVMFVVAAGLALWTFIGSPGSPPPVTSSTIDIGQDDKNEIPSDPEKAKRLVNPYQEDATFVLRDGKEVYEKHCIECHGSKGELPKASSLVSNIHNTTDGDFMRIVTYGVSGTPMTAKKDVLTLKERWQVVRYIRTEFRTPAGN